MSQFALQPVQLGPQPERVGPAIQVKDDVLGRAELDLLYQKVLASPVTPHGGYFMCPLEALERHKRGDPALLGGLRKFVPELAEGLLSYFLKLLDLVPMLPTTALVDFWWLVVQPSAMTVVHPHFDGAIDWADKSKPILTPVWSTLLHVGPREGLEGGSTFISPDKFPVGEPVQGPHHWLPVDVAMSLAKEWQEVTFKPGRVAVFNSSFLHFAGPVYATPSVEEPRVAIAVNFHERAPEKLKLFEGCSRLSLEEFELANRLGSEPMTTLMSVAQLLPPDRTAVLAKLMQRLSDTSRH